MSSSTFSPAPDAPALPSFQEAGYQYPVYVVGSALVLTTKTQPIPVGPTIEEVIAGTTVTDAWPVQQAADLANVLATAMGLTYPNGGAIAAPQAGEPWAMFLLITSSIQMVSNGQEQAQSDAQGPANATFPLMNPAPLVPLPASYTGPDKPTYQVFINPVVTQVLLPGYASTWQSNENCLSFPGFPGSVSGDQSGPLIVQRPPVFTFSYTTIEYAPSDEPGGAPVPFGYVHYTVPLDPTSTGLLSQLPANVTNYRQMLQISCQDVALPSKAYIPLVSNSAWLIPHETDHTNGILFTDTQLVSTAALTEFQNQYITQLTKSPESLPYCAGYPTVADGMLIPAGTPAGTLISAASPPPTAG